jgi:hypothetical protein
LIAGYPVGYRILQIAGYLATVAIVIYQNFIRTLQLGFGGFLEKKLPHFKDLKRKKIRILAF